VEMRGSMISPVHVDGNPEELTELWQCIFLTLSASSLSSTYNVWNSRRGEKGDRTTNSLPTMPSQRSVCSLCVVPTLSTSHLTAVEQRFVQSNVLGVSYAALLWRSNPPASPRQLHALVTQRLLRWLRNPRRPYLRTT
jgi:hypothetical protein